VELVKAVAQSQASRRLSCQCEPARQAQGASAAYSAQHSVFPMRHSDLRNFSLLRAPFKCITAGAAYHRFATVNTPREPIAPPARSVYSPACPSCTASHIKEGQSSFPDIRAQQWVQDADARVGLEYIAVPGCVTRGCSEFACTEGFRTGGCKSVLWVATNKGPF
jgi:hypothetical protein